VKLFRGPGPLPLGRHAVAAVQQQHQQADWWFLPARQCLESVPPVPHSHDGSRASWRPLQQSQRVSLGPAEGQVEACREGQGQDQEGVVSAPPPTHQVAERWDSYPGAKRSAEPQTSRVWVGRRLHLAQRPGKSQLLQGVP
jgi:hypothetical protein